MFAGINSRKKSKKWVALVGAGLSTLLVGSVASAFAATSSSTPASAFVQRDGNKLTLGGKDFRFSGANLYWVGLDDNIRDGNGEPTYPTNYRVDSGFNSATAMGVTVARTHTVGISVGCKECIEPTLGVFNDNAFTSIDYAVADAAKHNIKLVVPLTDQWHYFHGGKHTFTNWQLDANGKQKWPDLEGKTPVDDSTNGQKAREANFYTDPQTIADFKTYVAHVLNHVDPATGVALKDNPTIMSWETGNEIWDATPAWTENIASYIKVDLGAKQLVADGSAASGMTVAKAALDAPHIDIVGGHFYPIDVNWMNSDANIAAAKNKVYMVGEYDWNNNLSPMLSAVETNKNIAGDMYWTILPIKEDGVPESHNDCCTMHIPADNSNMAAAQAKLKAHAAIMSAGVASVPVTVPAPTKVTTPPATTAPVTVPTTGAPKPPVTQAPPIATIPVTTPPVTAAPTVPSSGSANDDSFIYKGNWSTSTDSPKYKGDDHYSANTDDNYRVDFSGTQIKVYSATASHHGIAGIRVDGGTEVSVDLYSANRVDQALVFTSPVLPAGKHTIQVRVTGNKNQKSTGTVVSADRVDIIGANAVPVTTPPTKTTVPATVPSGQRGLSAAYFDNTDLSGTPVFTRTDANIDFNWNGYAPDNRIGGQNFSVRWSGKITVATQGAYEFGFIGDDGFRIFVDGRQVTQDWSRHNSSLTSGSIILSPGAHSITVEYFQGLGASTAHLLYKTPTNQTMQVIPNSVLSTN